VALKGLSRCCQADSVRTHGYSQGGLKGYSGVLRGGTQWALKGVYSGDIQGTRGALGGLERLTALEERRTHRLLTRDSWLVEAHPGGTLGIFRGAQWVLRGVQMGQSGVHRVLRGTTGTNGTRRG
jgi:hypothetical protein